MNVLHYFATKQIEGIKRPSLRPGDIVRVETRITEGDKSRLQNFEGTVLGVRGSGPSTMFTVRRVTGGFGVERIMPLYSPLITSINIVKRQKVRRAKLSYLRLAGRRRVKEDVEAMQRHIKQEQDVKRLADEAKRREAEEKEKEERAAKKAEADAKAAAEAKAEESKPEEKKE